MGGSLNPAEMRAHIVERLVGDTGEPDHVIPAARSLAERALPAIRAGLGAMFAAPLGVEIRGVELVRFGAARPDPQENGVLSIAASPSSPDALALAADSRAVAILVSSLFGGDADTPIEPIARPLSPTEIDVAAMAFEEVAKAVNGSGPRAFQFDLPLAAPLAGAELAELALRDGPAVRVDFTVSCGRSNGRLSLVMPQRVLLKHRGDASAPSASDRGDAEWGARFGEEVMRSSVTLQATMPLGRMTLADLAGLAPGQVIAFGEGARSQVKLSARHKTLFVCDFGKLGQNYTVRVRQPYDARQDILDGLVEG
jgi:flagellar motor switch protein FliM